MAAYPTLRTQAGQIVTPLNDGRVIVRATNGTAKVRQLWPAEKVAIELDHVLTAAEKASLESHYASHREASFSYTAPGGGNTYTVVYAAPPTLMRAGPSHWQARVRLQEV